MHYTFLSDLIFVAFFKVNNRKLKGNLYTKQWYKILIYKFLALKFDNFYKVFCSIVEVKVVHVSDVSFVQSLIHESIKRSKKFPLKIRRIQFLNLGISAVTSSALIFVAISQNSENFYKFRHKDRQNKGR